VRRAGNMAAGGPVSDPATFPLAVALDHRVRVVLRSVLMKPEREDVVDRLVPALERLAG